MPAQNAQEVPSVCKTLKQSTESDRVGTVFMAFTDILEIPSMILSEDTGCSEIFLYFPLFYPG
jgi:hypothetical protein